MDLTMPRRRWLRFSLRTLFAVVTAGCITAGWLGWNWRIARERQLLRIQERIDALAADSGHRREFYAQWKELRDMGVEAFPEVVSHLDDKRYAISVHYGPRSTPRTVGHACFALLRCNLEPYNEVMLWGSMPPREMWWRPVYSEEFFSTQKKARAWLATHQGKTLVELQIEVLEWVITHRSKRKVDISQTDEAYLQDLLDKLKVTRQPLKPAHPWP